MEEYFPEFAEKGTTLRGIPKFLEISYQALLFHLTFFPKFPEFLVEWKNLVEGKRHRSLI